MDVKTLQEKVAKATENVEKRGKTIERHEAQLAKKIEVLVKLGYDKYVIMTDIDKIKWPTPGQGGGPHYWEACEVEGKRRDIKDATKKLHEAQQVLSNWQRKLQDEMDKEQFIDEAIPEVIKQFMESWKKMAYKWHIIRYKKYKLLCMKLEKRAKKAIEESGIENTWQNRKALNDYLESKKLDYDTRKRITRGFGGMTVLEMERIRNWEDRHTYLDKVLEAEKRAKMLDLVHRITDVVGAITDAKGLRVSQKGNLDGLIVGTVGKARISTIGAGGYNIQCFHFRTLVHKID
jgi:hypothetical protein